MKKLLIKMASMLLWLLDKNYRGDHQIKNNTKKIVKSTNCDFDSDFGVALNTHRTVPYNAWKLKTNCYDLICADQHRVFRENGMAVWVKDLQVGDKIKTDDGFDEVVKVYDTGVPLSMYSIDVHTKDPNDAMNNKYYTNGILSHNTTTAAAYLLWKAMFNADTSILITGNKFSAAMEIMDRIRFSYEECPDYIRAGVVSYNKGTIQFDNGSKITARATTADSGRGLSVSVLYCVGKDSKVMVMDPETMEEWESTIEDLYELID